MVDAIEFPVGDCKEKAYTVERGDQEKIDDNHVIESGPGDFSKGDTESKGETRIGSIASELSRVGVRIAKKFSSRVYLGRVTDVYDAETENATPLAEDFDGDVFYHILYEDGDEEDFTYEELQEGIALYSDVPKRRRQKYENRTNLVTPTPGMTSKTSSSFLPLYSERTPIHTLILGTHPGRNSLNNNQYFAHRSNAFWWIAGDCLGFRRDTGEKRVEGEYMKLCADLRYDESHIIPYHDQVNILCRHGFALWDVIASCDRHGSLDSAIKNDKPNDIQEFLRKHPTIKTIAFANGKSGLAIFYRHFHHLFESGVLALETTFEGPWSNFGPLTSDLGGDKASNPLNKENGIIKCKCVPSVSPAATNMTYREKRDTWDTVVFSPGLNFHQQLSELNRAGSATNKKSRGQNYFPMELLNKGGRIGMYLPEARRHRIARFHAKRKTRRWGKRIQYDCRSNFALSRPRIHGQFVKKFHADLEL